MRPLRLFALALIGACSATGGAPGEDAIAGIDWKLRSLNGQSVLPGTTITLRFGEAGRLTGKAQNSYFAEYTLADGALRVSDIGMTRMHKDDPPGAMAQEASFLETLGRANTARRDGETLVLSSGGNPTIVLGR